MKHQALIDWLHYSPLLLPLHFPDDLQDDGKPLTHSFFFEHLKEPSFQDRFIKQFEELREQQSRKWRIGIEYEDAYHALFLSHPKLSAVYRGIHCMPTGELDFLIALHSYPNRYLHLETAVKFYLCDETGGSKDPFIFKGPERKDTLQKKLMKLGNEQLKRFEQDPFLKARIPLREDAIVSSHPLSQGILFYPYNEDPFSFLTLLFKPNTTSTLDLLHPLDISETHAKGFWITQSKVNHLLKSLSSDVTIQKCSPKSEWIRYSSPKLLPTFDPNLQITEPELFSLTKIEKTSHNQRYECRFFIVPDHWQTL